MDETQLCTTEKIRQFLGVSAPIKVSAAGDDTVRYAHISRVLAGGLSVITQGETMANIVGSDESSKLSQP